MKWPAYPKYKDSGIEWLGEVPEHWGVMQLRHASQILDCKHRTVQFLDDGIPVASIKEVHGFEVNLRAANRTSEEEYCALIEGGRRPRRGDLIYSRNATVGDVALVATDATFCMGQDVCLIRSQNNDSKFMLYLLRSDALLQQLESLMIGSTFRRINVGQIHGYWTCLPPLPEQHAIASFLDRETGRIDLLVSKKRTLIERLKEKRTALISRTVTRGLPPEAARAAGLPEHPSLKRSGIEWLGEVPEHWGVLRGRYAMWVNPPSPRLRMLHPDASVSFVPMEAVGVNGGLELEHARVIAEVSGSYTEFQDGDVVVAKITPCFENGKGAVAKGLLNKAAYGTTELHVLRAKKGLNDQFLFYTTLSFSFRKLGESEMYGAGGQKRVPPEFNREYPIPLPPLSEQRAIAAYLDAETAKLDALVTKVETAIERLLEYRTALITAAVTGKLDVRGGE